MIKSDFKSAEILRKTSKNKVEISQKQIRQATMSHPDVILKKKGREINFKDETRYISNFSLTSQEVYVWSSGIK